MKTISNIAGIVVESTEKLTPYQPMARSSSGLFRQFFNEGVLILNRQNGESFLFAWTELESAAMAADATLKPFANQPLK